MTDARSPDSLGGRQVAVFSRNDVAILIDPNNGILSSHCDNVGDGRIGGYKLAGRMAVELIALCVLVFLPSQKPCTVCELTMRNRQSHLGADGHETEQSGSHGGEKERVGVEEEKGASESMCLKTEK